MLAAAATAYGPLEDGHLWSVLGVALLLLALMAYRLSRELADKPSNP